jgi:hypothetical protein
MEITFGVLIFCIVAFFVAGFIDSIAGGAGFVTAPSLLLIGMPPHMALGTGKLATSIGCCALDFLAKQSHFEEDCPGRRSFGDGRSFLWCFLRASD